MKAPPKSASLDHEMMGLALREGKKGRTSPNPHVGAVLVRGGRVVAKGFHRRAGAAHAEVAALAKAGKRARGSTLYVTLEPCNHHGRTGPCTEAIVRAGIARVVVGCADPTGHARGGRQKLRRAGVEVTVGVRREEASRLIADFEKHARTGLPFVTLKAAVTLDGRIATASGDSKWITGPAARRHAHRLRDQSDAVMVGVGTVLLDDPRLDVRHVRGRDPVRVVLDSRLRTPPDAALLNGGALIFHTAGAAESRRRRLLRAGAELFPIRKSARGIDLRRVLAVLGERGIVRLLVEGGGTLHGTLLDQGLADRAAIFIAPRILGDPRGISLAMGRPRKNMKDAILLKAPKSRRFGDDIFIEGEL